jgi:hypothetical protein
LPNFGWKTNWDKRWTATKCTPFNRREFPPRFERHGRQKFTVPETIFDQLRNATRNVDWQKRGTITKGWTANRRKCRITFEFRKRQSAELHGF